MINKFERLLTRLQARKIDHKAQEEFGIPAILLMENAGRGVAEEILKIVKNKEYKVAVFCGKGNNGGDGFCAARHLLAAGIKPDIFLVGKVSAVKNGAKINLSILLKLKQKIILVNEDTLGQLRRKIAKYNLVIDALLGVGLQGEVGGVYGSLINLINRSKAYVLSIDIPSGLDATNGKVLGPCIKADQTVTFVSKKRGMVLGEGSNYCGHIVVKGLGLSL